MDDTKPPPTESPCRIQRAKASSNDTRLRNTLVSRKWASFPRRQNAILFRNARLFCW